MMHAIVELKPMQNCSLAYHVNGGLLRPFVSLTVTANCSEPVLQPVLSVDGLQSFDTATTANNMEWAFTWELQLGDILFDTQNPSIQASVTDRANNSDIHILTGNFTIDIEPKVNVSLTSSAEQLGYPGKVWTGDQLVLIVAATEPVSLPRAMVLGHELAAQTLDNESRLFKFTWEVLFSDPPGPVSLVVCQYTDAVGTQGANMTNTTDGTSIVVDRTPPQILLVEWAVRNSSYPNLLGPSSTVWVALTCSELVLRPVVWFERPGFSLLLNSSGFVHLT